MQSDTTDHSIDSASSGHNPDPYHHHQYQRGQSCSPTRLEKRIDSRNVFSTVRRTRSPYRKQSLDSQNTVVTSKRPPIPRKFQNSVGVLEHATGEKRDTAHDSSWLHPQVHPSTFTVTPLGMQAVGQSGRN